jgi:cytochrome c
VLSPRILLPLLLVLTGAGSAAAQGPTYGVGRTPTPDEVRAWDIAISPTGEELPPGSGTARQGALVFEQQGCAMCHGANGTGGEAPRLVRNNRQVSDPWDYGRILPIRAPYATGVWDFIFRGMPLGAPETLTPDQVYALTALLLYWNGIVEEDQVMDQRTLPLVEMPNETNWAPLPDWQPGQPRLPGYPF